MKRQPVKSSVIRSVGYDEREQILEVEFERSGEVYQYFDVPRIVFWQFVNASSLGTFFDRYIRDHYRHREV